jgi:hypothetical protein
VILPTIPRGKPTSRDERRAQIAERIQRSMTERCPIVNVKGDSPFASIHDGTTIQRRSKAPANDALEGQAAAVPCDAL